MLVGLSGMDITAYINEKSYSVNSSDEYEEWKDGNFVTHRIYNRSRVRGSFVVALYGRDGMSTSKFIELLDGATENGVTNINVYVSNKARMARINAYVTTEISKHRQLASGEYFDLLKITLEER